MAFTKSNVSKTQIPGGLIVERGTWTLTGGDTTGTLLADTTGNPDIAEIWYGEIRSTTAARDVTASKSASAPSYDIVATANDVGTYTFVGRAA
jgi:hypothetical protein